ncbi:MAG: histidine kinase [Gammaproteobacteria bacterium]|nr:histidine kinase [Gammaproteobacteria bacterium]
MDKNKHKPGTFLPDFCGVRMVFVIIMLAELLAIVVSLSQDPYFYIRTIDLALNSLFIQWVALSSTAALCILRKFLGKIDKQWVPTISYILTLIITYIVSELAWYVVVLQMQSSFISSGHAVFITRVMSISAIVWALALRYFYVNHQWKLRIESESNARFQALQSRIKPHFLFNCMNTIASLVRRKPDLAEESIEDLADLFRASLQETNQSSTLADEITLCKRYLRIEKHRLGERLNVEWKIDNTPGDFSLPPLIIQPLIENAIYHGIELNPEGGTISIMGNLDKSEIRITITNPVNLKQSSATGKTGNQVALNNIRQRLASYYDEEELLKIDHDDKNYRVTIIIPKHT